MPVAMLLNGVVMALLLVGTAAQVSAKFVGSAPDGGLLYDDCSQHVEFELTQMAERLYGWVQLAVVVVGDCQPLLSEDQPTQQFRPSPIAGTLNGSIVSLAIFQMRMRNGVPNRVTAFLLSGTVDQIEMFTTGTMVGPRSWSDTNQNGLPDCDFAVAGINGECGRVVGPARAVTLRATRTE